MGRYRKNHMHHSVPSIVRVVMITRTVGCCGRYQHHAPNSPRSWARSAVETVNSWRGLKNKDEAYRARQLQLIWAYGADRSDYADIIEDVTLESGNDRRYTGD